MKIDILRFISVFLHNFVIIQIFMTCPTITMEISTFHTHGMRQCVPMILG